MNASLERQLKASRYIRRPMEEMVEDSAEMQWMHKPVIEERCVPMAARLDELQMIGPGLLCTSRDVCRTQEGSVCLQCPMVQPVQNPTGRAYTTTEVRVPFERENLTRYNRISLWIYVESQNSAINNLTFYFYNEGPVVIPVPGRFEGYHSVTVRAGEWKRVLWEIPHLCRERVTGFGMTVLSSGVSYPGNTDVRVYFDDLRLQTVEPDVYKDYDLPRGEMAYCHSGYRSEGRKQALIQGFEGEFSLLDAQGRAVYTAFAHQRKDGFAELDFSQVTKGGWYTLRAGRTSSRPFPIGHDAYLSAAWKTLNFFFAERCGFPVQGAHAECHLDVMSRHPDGRQKCVAGGWHDAGDLTQDGRNTMECALAMMELSEAMEETEPELAARALEEARWGLDWMMRIRWGDGYRHCGRIIGFYTDNIIGTTDDVVTQAENRPYDNLLSAQVFAHAARVFKKEDPVYAALCGRMAREDMIFGAQWVNKAPAQSFSFATQLQLNAQAACSALELYRAFGEPEQIEQAARYARVVMRCQQLDVPEGFALPVRGYFYETIEKKREQAYFHRSYEHVPVQMLCELLRLAPNHVDASRWCESLAAYAAGMKAAMHLTPYGLVPAAVYQLDNADFSNMYHEGSRSEGEPTMEEYNAQLLAGTRLDERHYLRVFPVAHQFRGFHAIHLSKTLAALEAAQVLGDRQLRDIGVRQMEWVMGMNPFATCGQYGEGYRYHPLYTGLQPQIVGALPVGFETFGNEDLPYYPLQAIATYKEIWVHTTCRLMKCIAYLGFPKSEE